MEKYKQILYGTTALIAFSLPGEGYANNVSGNPVSDVVKYMFLAPFNEMNKFSKELSKDQYSNKPNENNSSKDKTLERKIESKKLPTRTYIRPQRRLFFRR